MRKIIIYKPGGYNELKIENSPDLSPAPNEVVVQTKAIGVNYADIIIRWGLYESAKKFVGWPITPGFEFSGIVLKCGSDVKKFKEGDSVFGCTLFNAYADQVKVKQENLFFIPKGWSFSQVAGMPATFITAYHALFQLVVIRPNSKILVHSAAGGVGTALLQMSRIKGFKTIAIVGSNHKIETAVNFGATHVVSKEEGDIWPKIKEIFPEGFDVALDANGVSTLKKSWQSLAPCGKLMIYGFHSMFPRSGGRINYPKLVTNILKTPFFHPLLIPDGNRSLVFFNLSFLFEKEDLLTEAITQILSWIEEKKLVPPTVKEYKFEEVSLAHQHLESGSSVGKIVLTI